MTISGIKVLNDQAAIAAIRDSNYTLNEVGCLNNQYLVIADETNISSALFYWSDSASRFIEVPQTSFDCPELGKVVSKDLYQLAYMDSLARNEFTICSGSAGTGKSLLALSYALQQQAKRKIDKIVIFANPLPMLDSEKLGYLPGTQLEKLMGTSIGSILLSKLGSFILDQKIVREEIIVLPTAVIRGYQAPEKSFLYITEAQNMTSYLLQTSLQRVCDGTKVCIEGDFRQVDKSSFEGNNNGMLSAISTFEGEDYFSYIDLHEIYRGKIAKKAQEMSRH